MFHTLAGYFRHIEGNICTITVVSTVMPDQRVSGVGYQVTMLMQDINELVALEKIDERRQFISILTHTDIHESAISLYGFADYETLKTFRALLKVQGVGPTTAVNILSSMSPRELAQRICDNDIGRLSDIKGIGPQTAKRLVAELRGGRIDAALVPEHRSSAGPAPVVRDLFDAPAP